MRKTLIAITSLALMVACGGKTQTPPSVPQMQTSADSMAYVMGMNIGRNLMEVDSLLNIDMVAEGKLGPGNRGGICQNPSPGGKRKQSFCLAGTGYEYSPRSFVWQKCRILLRRPADHRQNGCSCCTRLPSAEYCCYPKTFCRQQSGK